ncbi:MAG TPA: PQQ-binding-like beta-propeller repeat protein [Planctomycetota bacterium]|nr:PQQ-binding-like beta-propeller repeat protein [Planctomycetota bacterium]
MSPKLAIVLTLISLLCRPAYSDLSSVALAEEDEWPRWRGSDGRGLSTESWKPEALLRPKMLYRVQVGEGVCSVSIAAGRLYTMGNQDGKDVVSCLDAKTGKPLWRHVYKCAAGNFYGPRATPTVDGGMVYTLSRNGLAFALDAASGEPRWQADLMTEHGAKNNDYGITGSPLLAGDAVIYNANLRGIALDRKTGKKIWSSASGYGGFASPVAIDRGGKPAIALFGAGELCLLDPATGQSLANFPWKTSFDANSADPVFFDGKIFITSGWDRGCALLSLAGDRLSPLWQNTEMRSQLASPVYLDGHLYGIDDNTPNGQLRCLDAATGKTKWTRKGGFGNLVVADGRILTIDKQGTLLVVAADPSACKELAKLAVLGSKAKNWIAPVLADGLLYCRDSEGTLVCLDVH